MERLTSEQLKQTQEKTVAAPRMRYDLLARLLFVSMDLLYGRKKTLAKFSVLEIIARMPYQAWENVAYIAITPRYIRKKLKHWTPARLDKAPAT